MAAYRVAKSDHIEVVLVKEPVDNNSTVVRIKNPDASWFPTVKHGWGARYDLTITVTQLSNGS